MGLGISTDLYRAGSSIARGLAKRYDVSRAQAGGAFADSIRALMQDDYPMTGATRPAPAIKDFVASKGKKGILSNIMDDNAMFYSPSSAKQFDNVPAGTLKSSVAKKRSASNYVDDREIGAAHIVSPKGSVKKVKGVTQVRRGSARERLIAKRAKARTKGPKGGMR